ITYELSETDQNAMYKRMQAGDSPTEEELKALERETRKRLSRELSGLIIENELMEIRGALESIQQKEDPSTLSCTPAARLLELHHDDLSRLETANPQHQEKIYFTKRVLEGWALLQELKRLASGGKPKPDTATILSRTGILDIKISAAQGELKKWNTQQPQIL